MARIARAANPHAPPRSTPHVIRPGFVAQSVPEGRPRVFISHGRSDNVLPIDRCSRRIVPALRRAGYAVDYREFADGHTVPADMAVAALDTFVQLSSK